jgi:hypothetical protein
MIIALSLSKGEVQLRDGRAHMSTRRFNYTVRYTFSARNPPWCPTGAPRPTKATDPAEGSFLAPSPASAGRRQGKADRAVIREVGGSRRLVKHLIGKPMKLELSDEQAVALLSELDRIIDGDRFPLSPRIRNLKEIRSMIRPEEVHEPLPPPPLKRYEPPSRGRYRRRG